MASDASVRLYQAFVADDAARAISVIEQAKSAGIDHDRLFDQVFAPALSMLGAAWASGGIDEYQFTQAAVVADQVAGFVTPATGVATGVTVVVGTMQGELHSRRKALLADALAQAGHRVIDLGADVLPASFLDRVRETRAPIVLVCAETVAAASAAGRVREMLDSAGRGKVAMLVAGGPFSADERRARAVGAQGVVRSAEGALKMVEELARRSGVRT